MMNIENGLKKRREDIDEISKIIDRLEEESASLKPAKEQYEDKRKKINSLRKDRRGKKKDMDIIINFFKNIDESFLDKIYPLFADEKTDTETVKEK